MMAVSPAECVPLQAGAGQSPSTRSEQGMDPDGLSQGRTPEDTPRRGSGAREAHADPDRAEFTAALRQLADFIDTHPGLPVPRYDCAYIAPAPAGTCDAERRADVDRIAAVLGVDPTDNDGSHHMAEVTFGGRVRYRVTAITDARMDGYLAEATYYGSVQP